MAENTAWATLPSLEACLCPCLLRDKFIMSELTVMLTSCSLCGFQDVFQNRQLGLKLTQRLCSEVQEPYLYLFPSERTLWPLLPPASVLVERLSCDSVGACELPGDFPLCGRGGSYLFIYLLTLKTVSPCVTPADLELMM